MASSQRLHTTKGREKGLCLPKKLQNNKPNIKPPKSHGKWNPILPKRRPQNKCQNNPEPTRIQEREVNYLSNPPSNKLNRKLPGK